MTSRPVLTYTVLRLLAFLVPLAILWLLFPAMPWLAAVLATAIGASLSVIFLRNPRAGVSTRIYNARAGKREHDADAEDAAADAATVDTAIVDTTTVAADEPRNDQL